jgi:hypothetical protein
MLPNILGEAMSVSFEFHLTPRTKNYKGYTFTGNLKTFLKYHGRRGGYIARIMEAYGRATIKDLRAGIAWYDRAQSVAEKIHPNVLVGAGVLAALSPQTDWMHNKLYATMTCESWLRNDPYPPSVSTGNRLGKAWDILCLENPTVEAITSILNGPKTQRFFRNIIGDMQAVTIDVWAKRIATGFKDDSSPKPGHDYNTLEQAYQIAASRLGIDPRDLQAAVWVNARGTAE